VNSTASGSARHAIRAYQAGGPEARQPLRAAHRGAHPAERIGPGHLGQAGLCFKSGSGEATTSTDDDLKQLLNFDESGAKVSLTTDDLGFKWLVIDDGDITSLVTRIHGANTTMVEHGFGPRLLCAVFGFVPQTPPGEGSVRMVYLLKQGTFYPFAPTGHEQRDNDSNSASAPSSKRTSSWRRTSRAGWRCGTCPLSSLEFPGESRRQDFVERLGVVRVKLVTPPRSCVHSSTRTLR